MGPTRELTDFEKRTAAILSKLHNTLASKNQDYGDSYARSVEKYGPTVSLIRLSDKFNRYENLIMNPGESTVEETKEDTLLDLAGYAILELERLARAKKEVEPVPHRPPTKSPFEEGMIMNWEHKPITGDPLDPRNHVKPPYADLDD